MHAEEPGKEKVPDEFISKGFKQRYMLAGVPEDCSHRPARAFPLPRRRRSVHGGLRTVYGRTHGLRNSCRLFSKVAHLWQRGLIGTVKGSTEGLLIAILHWIKVRFPETSKLIYKLFISFLMKVCYFCTPKRSYYCCQLQNCRSEVIRAIVF